LRGEACQPSDQRVRGVTIKSCAAERPMFGIEVVVHERQARERRSALRAEDVELREAASA
jgi:hypothetical protein